MLHVVVPDQEKGESVQNVRNAYRERTVINGIAVGGGGSGNGVGVGVGGPISVSAMYPVAGALLGTCLGGPVGLLAGVKLGGIAALGGSVFGECTTPGAKTKKIL